MNETPRFDQFNLTNEELLYVSTGALNNLYHEAQMAGVAERANHNHRLSLLWFDLAIRARHEVMCRYNDADYGHVQIYNELVAEYNNTLDFINYSRSKHFQFVSGRLVGNALDSGVIIDPSTYPRKWKYHVYKRKRNQSYIN